MTVTVGRRNLPLATGRLHLEDVLQFMVATSTENASVAREMCEQGLWAQLLALTQDWQREEPADYKAWYYAGLGFSGLGQFVQAETAYRQALALDATDPKVWNNLAGILFENLERPAEAIRCIEQAVNLNPGHKQGWSNLAVMVGQLGWHEQAMAYADRAIALDPKFVEAYLHKGSAARALGKTEIIREVCNALATIPPENFRRAR